MSHDPKIQVECEIEYKGRFFVNVSEFEGYAEDDIESALQDYAEELMIANLSVHIENLPRVVAEIREALGVRKEEELEQ